MNQSQSMLNVVTIGGGGGHSAVVKALKDLPISLTALCNTVDDGGGSGKLMREYGVHSPGDFRRILTALAQKNGEPLNYRFSSGAYEGQTISNLLLAGLELSTGSFQKAIDTVREWLNIKEGIAPITEGTPVLHAKTHSGKEIIGQKNVVNSVRSQNDAIETLWLDPKEIKLSDIARDSLKKADYIIITMGDLYSSIAPFFCIREVKQMWPELSAKIIWLPNFAVTPGHVHYEKHSEALKFLQTLMPDFHPNMIVVHQGELSEKTKNILAEKSYGVSMNDIQDSPTTKVIAESLIDENFVPQKTAGDAIERSPLRYDLKKLQSIFEKILI